MLVESSLNEVLNTRALAIISIFMLSLSLSLFLFLNSLFSQRDIVNIRNFYGILSVIDVTIDGEAERRLIDGTTSHGTQSLQADKKQIARSYYRANTGIALALEQLANNGQVRAGIVGLGAGTLAAYGRVADHFTFYELNPNVERIARSYFTYLEQSKASIEIVLGDGRTSLTNELSINGSHQYQLLVIDAFSSGSIPIHLLTKEAFGLYWKHLASDGILAVHISNSHLQLSPLVRGLAKAFDKDAFYFKTVAEYQDQRQVEWVLLTGKTTSLGSRLYPIANEWPNTAAKTILWKDNFSNLLSVLR